MAADDTERQEQTAAVGRATGLMTATIFASRVTGYLRIFALAYAIGLFGALPNAYNLANVMPNMFYELFAGGILSSVLIPIITKHLIDGSKEEAWRLANTITNLALIVLGALIVFAILFPSPFVYTQTFISHEKAPLELITFFFQIFAPQILFYAIAAIHSSILFSHKKFVIPTIAPVLNNITVIVTVLFFFRPVYERDPMLGLWVLAIGTTLGVAVMSLVQLPSVYRLGLRYKPILDLKHPSMAKVKVMAFPVLGYVALNQAGLAVANAVAITFNGGVAAVQYAWPLFHLAYALLSYPISNALFPNLSAHVAKEDFDSFRKDVSLGVRTIGFLLIPSTLVMFALSLPLVGLLLEHGAFAADERAAPLTAHVLQGFSLGIFSFSIWMFLTKAFFALHDTKTPTWVNGIGVGIYVASNLTLVQYLGVAGIAYGHTVAYTVASAVLLIVLRKRINGVDGSAIVRSIVPQAAAGVVTAAVCYFIAYGIDVSLQEGLLSDVLQVAVAVTVGAAVYLLIARIRSFPELDFIASVVPGFRKVMRLRPKDSPAQ